MLRICMGDDDRGLKMAGNDMRVNCYGATPVSQYKVMWGENSEYANRSTDFKVNTRLY